MSAIGWYVGFHANGETDPIRVPCADRDEALRTANVIRHMITMPAVTHATLTTDTGATVIKLSTVSGLVVDL